MSELTWSTTGVSLPPMLSSLADELPSSSSSGVAVVFLVDFVGFAAFSVVSFRADLRVDSAGFVVFSLEPGSALSNPGLWRFDMNRMRFALTCFSTSSSGHSGYSSCLSASASALETVPVLPM